MSGRCWPLPSGLWRASASLYRADARTLGALGLLLLLAQLPHVLHLPVWVSACGVLAIALRWFAHHHPNSRWLGVLLAPVPLTLASVAAALLIRGHYGYFLGRDPCVAFLFLLVAFKYAELRRPADATIVLCLSAFLLLTQYFYSQSIFAAVLTLPAVIALGNALIVIRDPGKAGNLTKNARLTGTLLLQGLPLAILLFVLFPRLPGPLWSQPTDAIATTGLSDRMMPGSVSSLTQDGSVAFRVEFDGPAPDRAQLYWRGPVLSDFDGRLWKVSRTAREVTPNHADDQGIGYRVLLQPNNQRWLFALEHPVSLPRPARQAGVPLATLSTDLQLRSDEPVKRVTGYWQRSLLSDRFAAMVPPTREERTVPGRNPRTIELAQSLRTRSTGDRHFLQLILNRFSQLDYRYTLQPGLLGDRPVDEFLFDTRRGFCEHYASAFVLLARAGGLPARVVTGYMGGEMNGDYMIVRQADAHAWAEVLLAGQWQRIDPTAAVAPSRVDTGLQAALPEGESVPAGARRGPGMLRALRLHLDALNHQWQRLVVNFNDDSQARFWKRFGWPKPELWVLCTVVLLFAGAWCALVLCSARATAGPNDSVERDWQRLQCILARQRIHRGNTESPGRFVTRAVQLYRHDRTRVHDVGTALLRARFEPMTSDERDRLQRAWTWPLRRLWLIGWIRRWIRR